MATPKILRNATAENDLEQRADSEVAVVTERHCVERPGDAHERGGSGLQESFRVLEQ
jgi:hypothetical protein